ncbi:MAG: Mth938-like domain-containing protein [Granulosicoccaceae bacterium]|jgi:uncharacterized protein
MKLHQHIPGEQFFIRSCEDSSITVNEERLENSFIIQPGRLQRDWPVGHIDALDKPQVQALARLEVEILLLGTGQRQHFPDQRLLLPITDRGIGIEIMSTAAACRTYNILMAENREVAAALILETA